MQSDGEGDPIDIDIDWSGLADSFASEFEGILRENLVGWIVDAGTNLVETTIDQIVEYFETLFEGLITPIVGTPAPQGPSSSAPVDIAFQTATNAPWDTLISDLYFDGIVGLALGIQFITWIIIGLRYKSINPAVREKL